MLHQIRKMVGLCALAVRTRTPSNLVLEAYKESRLNIPKAPALGLLLQHPIFGVYNAAMGGQTNRDQLDFAEFADQIDAFKKEFIYNEISAEEAKGAVYVDE